MTVNRDSFITAMRQVASSVTVVTTDGLAGLAGATVSTFISVSTNPPSVLISLKSDSWTSKMVVENKVFCVNVLPEDAIQTAQVFSGLLDQTQNNRFKNVEFSPTPFGVILSGATSFECVLQRTIKHGTHSVIVGDVMSITNASIHPLTYFDGAYHFVQPQHKLEGDPNANNTRRNVQGQKCG